LSLVHHQVVRRLLAARQPLAPAAAPPSSIPRARPSPRPIIAGQYVGGNSDTASSDGPPGGQLYTAVRRTPVRSGVAVNSAKIGELQKDETVCVLEKGADSSSGLPRLRIDYGGAAGWVSVTTPGGATLLAPTAGAVVAAKPRRVASPGRGARPSAGSPGRARPKFASPPRDAALPLRWQ
jgi:hypothetical protein